MTEYGVVLFDTNSSAMRAEAVLGRAGLAVKLIPTPRHLSSDCGVALRFAWADQPRVAEMLAQGRVLTAGLHPLPGGKHG